MCKLIQGFIGIPVFMLAGVAVAGELATQTYTRYVGAQGEIHLPKEFRQNWSHLGSWLVKDPKAPGYGFHNVYTQPEAINEFYKRGRFPDGTVLIKEIRNINSGEKTTGFVHWATDSAAWFVMVKDTRGRFKGNCNW